MVKKDVGATIVAPIPSVLDFPGLGPCFYKNLGPGAVKSKDFINSDTMPGVGQVFCEGSWSANRLVPTYRAVQGDPVTLDG